jgi:hypothetical protein
LTIITVYGVAPPDEARRLGVPLENAVRATLPKDLEFLRPLAAHAQHDQPQHLP